MEQELSWVPHFLDRMDYTYTQRAPRDYWHRFKDSMLPSDHFRRNVFRQLPGRCPGNKDAGIL